jgi:hypothetical protein
MAKLQSVDAWITYIDIWGFSHLVEHTKPEELHTRLEQTVHECTRVLNSSNPEPPRIFFFSDSLFLAFDIPRCGQRFQAFETCRDKTQEVIQIYLDQDFFPRGGMAFGNIAVAEGILFGQPVVRAARYEHALTAPLVMLPMLEAQLCFRENSPLTHKECSVVPTRNGGLVKALLIRAIHADDQLNKFIALRDKYLIEGPDIGAKALDLAVRLLGTGPKHD